MPLFKLICKVLKQGFDSDFQIGLNAHKEEWKELKAWLNLHEKQINFVCLCGSHANSLNELLYKCRQVENYSRGHSNEMYTDIYFIFLKGMFHGNLLSSMVVFARFYLFLLLCHYNPNLYMSKNVSYT